MSMNAPADARISPNLRAYRLNAKRRMHVETRQIRKGEHHTTTVVRLRSELCDEAQVAFKDALAGIDLAQTENITVDLTFLTSNDGTAIETLIDYLTSRPDTADASGMLTVIASPQLAERLRATAIDTVLDVLIVSERSAA